MIDGITDFYNQEFSVLRASVLENGIGGFSTEWTAVAEGLCRLRPMTGTEQESGDKKTVFGSHRLYCAPLDVTETDRIRVDYQEYDILWIKNPMSMGNHLEIELELRA